MYSSSHSFSFSVQITLQIDKLLGLFAHHEGRLANISFNESNVLV